jgi:4-alpha-glucanotransferase
MARPALPTLSDRTAGVLLHPTSLPGPADLGPAAYDFASWVRRAGLAWWQMLPVGPVGYGSSPYSALSAFAGSPALVSLEALVPWAGADAGRGPRDEVLRGAFAEWRRRGSPGLAAFARRARGWLADWALYAALKRAHGGGPWVDWPAALRSREPSALAAARRVHAEQIRFEIFCQWRFDEDWAALRARAHEIGLELIGDVPIFVAHDSADVWAHPELFQLDAEGRPTDVAGVPPDYFSTTGQRWGNPLYRWPRLRRTGYRWWLDRLATTLARFDAVRLDHFIGFQRYWEIPASEPTAMHGVWRPGPRAHFFETVRRRLGGRLPLIAEDLGLVTPAVKALRDRFELPGIRLLQFAFGTDPSAPDFVPHVYPRRAVVYTGTHDNDTTLGWYRSVPDSERAKARRYLNVDGSDIGWAFIRAVLASVADVAVVPMQDFLGLGSEARMNLPGTVHGNWAWRMAPGAADGPLAARIADLVQIYEREWKP